MNAALFAYILISNVHRILPLEYFSLYFVLSLFVIISVLMSFQQVHIFESSFCLFVFSKFFISSFENTTSIALLECLLQIFQFKIFISCSQICHNSLLAIDSIIIGQNFHVPMDANDAHDYLIREPFLLRVYFRLSFETFSLQTVRVFLF